MHLKLALLAILKGNKKEQPLLFYRQSKVQQFFIVYNTSGCDDNDFKTEV